MKAAQRLDLPDSFDAKNLMKQKSLRRWTSFAWIRSTKQCISRFNICCYKYKTQNILFRRAADLMEKLSPWNTQNTPASITDLFDAFKKILLSMTDLQYMVRCCIEGAMPTLQMTKDLLLLARTSIQKDSSKLCIRQSFWKTKIFLFLPQKSNRR